MTGGGGYRAVLALPYAVRTFVPAAGARLAYGLFPLATLFTVQQATGSFATAGLASAGFGVTAVLLPLKARLADRHSQRAVLPPLALTCAAALAGAAMVTRPAALVALITVAGLAAPPLGPAMRATWRRLTAGTGLKARAYGLDSVVEEALYLTGPLLAGLLVAAGPARWALLLTAALLLAGTLGMVATPPARDRRPPTGDDPGGHRWLVDTGPLRSPALRGLVVTILAVGTGTSAAYTCLAAFAEDRGAPGAAGLLEAALAVGSVTGGLLWGRREHAGRRHLRHLALLTGVLATGLAVAAAAAGLLMLGLVLCLTGTAVGPVYVVAYLAADDAAPDGSATEAGTWLNVAATAGGAAGAALAGTIAESRGPGPGFLTGAGLLAVTAVVTAVRSRREAVSAPDATG